MPRALWPLVHDRPTIQVALVPTRPGKQIILNLLADTGAGPASGGFDLLLAEQDCLACGTAPVDTVLLGGAYSGFFPLFVIPVRIPQLGFRNTVPVVGVPQSPDGFDGIACFQFLNRFTYGNFADPTQFGLER